MKELSSRFTQEQVIPLTLGLPLLVWGRSLTRNSLASSFMAGPVGAVTALPRGVAYAFIAGLPPVYGLYTVIVTPVIAGLYSFSLHLASVPTAAICIFALSVVSNFYLPDLLSFISAALTLTFLAGLIELALGLAKLGILVNFISCTMVICFPLAQQLETINFYSLSIELAKVLSTSQS